MIIRWRNAMSLSGQYQTAGMGNTGPGYVYVSHNYGVNWNATTAIASITSVCTSSANAMCTW